MTVSEQCLEGRAMAKRNAKGAGRGGRPVQLYMNEAMYAELLALAEHNLSSVSAEVRRAIERHLAAPEVRVGVPAPRRAGKTG